MGRSLTSVALAVLSAATGARAFSSLPSPGIPPLNSVINYNTDPNLSDLWNGTYDGCDFMENYPWEETFNSPVLNITKWDPTSLYGQDHCTGLAPAGPTTCTTMLPQMFTTGATMPDGSLGAVMRLSQIPCIGSAVGPGGACCNSLGTTCSNWAGSHLISLGCIQYGVLEMNIAVNLPSNGGGFYFTATYMVRGAPDPSWNEIDVGMVNTAAGLEFHATVFTAAPVAPTVTTQDALGFAPYPVGTSANSVTVSVINGVPAVQRFYNASFAYNFHTYKVVWTPTWQAWMIDTVVYRNISYSIWRPQSIRQILRTNIGTAYSVSPLPDSEIYIKRITYLPLSAAAINTAITCSSNFACNGPIIMGGTGSASGVFSIAANANSASGRRHLLQSSTPDGLNNIADAVANTVAGVPASAMAAYQLSYYFDFDIRIGNMGVTEMTSNPQVHAALIAGLDADIGHIGPSNVIVKRVIRAGSEVNTTLITATIDGFSTLDAATSGLAAIRTRDGTKLTAELIERALGRARVPDPVTFFKVAPGQGVTITISNATIYSTIGVAVNCAAGDQDKYEAAISGAVNSGYVQQSLSGSMSGATISAVNTVQAARAARLMKGKGGRSNTPPGAPRPPRPPKSPAAKKPPPPKKTKPPHKKHGNRGRSLRSSV